MILYCSSFPGGLNIFKCLSSKSKDNKWHRQWASLIRFLSEKAKRKSLYFSLFFYPRSHRTGNLFPSWGKDSDLRASRRRRSSSSQRIAHIHRTQSLLPITFSTAPGQPTRTHFPAPAPTSNFSPMQHSHLTLSCSSQLLALVATFTMSTPLFSARVCIASHWDTNSLSFSFSFHFLARSTSSSLSFITRSLIRGYQHIDIYTTWIRIGALLVLPWRHHYIHELYCSFSSDIYMTRALMWSCDSITVIHWHRHVAL